MIRLDPQYLHNKAKRCLWHNFEKDKKMYQMLSAQMIELMIAEHGLGLAANQVGMNLQMFVMKRENGDKIACFNPEVVKVGTDWHGDVMWSDFEEGCLSYPDVHYKILRPRTITAKWTNYQSTDVVQDLTDMEARCFLHEFDHCQGITFEQRYNNTIKKEYISDNIILEEKPIKQSVAI